MTARKPTPPDSALEQLPALAEVVAEISDTDAVLIRAALSRREAAAFDAARNIAARKRAR